MKSMEGESGSGRSPIDIELDRASAIDAIIRGYRRDWRVLRMSTKEYEETVRYWERERDAAMEKAERLEKEFNPLGGLGGTLNTDENTLTLNEDVDYELGLPDVTAFKSVGFRIPRVVLKPWANHGWGKLGMHPKVAVQLLDEWEVTGTGDYLSRVRVGNTTRLEPGPTRYGRGFMLQQHEHLLGRPLSDEEANAQWLAKANHDDEGFRVDFMVDVSHVSGAEPTDDEGNEIGERVHLVADQVPGERRCVLLRPILAYGITQNGRLIAGFDHTTRERFMLNLTETARDELLVWLDLMREQGLLV